MSFFSAARKKRHGILREQPLDGNERCVACAADCCRGFPSIELDADEYSRLESLGAARLAFTLDGRFYLIIENGCEFLDGNRCGIYDLRPRICRIFFCED
ncbi:flagellin N-methylase [Geobacter sp. OR-1]|uniref:YkgJ family cysteine cluster protein n=1 Tax=Geobacter sp. OR-1 TaxID=1266765 RepID=UPI000541BB8B|nr:YkgJ family cysteine cluster protein [Geobacter sp. OR-1]GAM09567.1 flagellin N-methylase [Geobacter sp. OR-1]